MALSNTGFVPKALSTIGEGDESMNEYHSDGFDSGEG